MEHVDIRAPRASIRAWRERAKASGMSLSAWLRRVADDGGTYETRPAEERNAQP